MTVEEPARDAGCALPPGRRVSGWATLPTIRHGLALPSTEP